MSAVVCGKRSLFEEFAVSTSPVSKRIRCSSSPIHFSPPRIHSSVSSCSYNSHLIEQLVSVFPDMDKQFLERALGECNDDLDSAIKRLNVLRLSTTDYSYGSCATKSYSEPDASKKAQDPSSAAQHQLDHSEWVELFVGEMVGALGMDDARARASRTLEAMEKSIESSARMQATKGSHEEITSLKGHVEMLVEENTVLKGQAQALMEQANAQAQELVAVKEQAETHIQENLSLKEQVQTHIQEKTLLKKAVSIQHEQLKALEMKNYALSVHLDQAQRSNSIPGHFNPDVF